MKIKLLIPFVGFVGLLPACNLFGFNQPEQPPLPTSMLALTLTAVASDTELDYTQIEAQTLDGEPIYLDVILLFKIDPSKMTQIQEQGGTNYAITLLKPVVELVIQDVTGRYLAHEIVFDKRNQWIEDMRLKIKDGLSTKGFLYSDFLVHNVQFTKEFNAKIEQEVIVTLTAEAQQLTITPTP